jgi:hypothetical protein
MRAAAWLAVLGVYVGLAACGGPRGGTSRPSDAPAASWSTVVPPYRLPAVATALWVDDRRAIVAAGPGVIAEVELATGAVATTRTPELAVDLKRLERLADGRLIGAVETGGRLRVIAVDAERRLALVREDAGPGWETPAIAVAPDGKVAMLGKRQPLRLYAADAVTVGAMLGGEVAEREVLETLLFADGGRMILTSRLGGRVAYAVDSGSVVEYGAGEWLAAAAAAPRVLYRHNGAISALDLTTGVATELAARSDSEAAISRDATRAAIIADGAIVIYDVATARAIGRYALGTPGISGGKLAFTPAGNAVVVATGSIVRVVDVAAGTITPAGPGPFRSPTFLAMTHDAVIATADRARRWPLTGGAAAQFGPDEPEITDAAVAPGGELIALALTAPDQPNGQHPLIEVTTWKLARAPVETARWERRDSIASMAIDDTGQLLVGAWDTRTDVPNRNTIELGRARGGWKQLIEIVYDSYVDAIDPVTRLAAVSRDGAVRVIRLPGLSPVSTAAIPSCDGTGNVHLDGPGKRLATDDDKTVWVWDLSHAEGELVARAAFGTRVGELVFLPGRPEVVLDLDDRLGLWDYGAGAAWSTPVPGIIARVAVDPSATRAAIALTNGRVMVFPIAELRRGAAQAMTRGSDDVTCSADPLEPPQVEDPDDPYGDGDSDGDGYDDDDEDPSSDPDLGPP